MRDVVVIGWMVAFACALIAAVVTRRREAWTAALALFVLAGLTVFAVLSGTG